MATPKREEKRPPEPPPRDRDRDSDDNEAQRRSQRSLNRFPLKSHRTRPVGVAPTSLTEPMCRWDQGLSERHEPGVCLEQRDQASEASMKKSGAGESTHKEVRYIDIHEDDEIDEKLMTPWVRQASQLPGWAP